jgi:hypothetical protein
MTNLVSRTEFCRATGMEQDHFDTLLKDGLPCYCIPAVRGRSAYVLDMEAALQFLVKNYRSGKWGRIPDVSKREQDYPDDMPTLVHEES